MVNSLEKLKFQNHLKIKFHVTQFAFFKEKNHIILEQATGASFYTTVTCLSNHVLHLFLKRSLFNYVYLYAVVGGQVKMEAREGIRSRGTGFSSGCGLLCVGPVN